MLPQTHTFGTGEQRGGGKLTGSLTLPLTRIENESLGYVLFGSRATITPYENTLFERVGVFVLVCCLPRRYFNVHRRHVFLPLLVLLFYRKP